MWLETIPNFVLWSLYFIGVWIFIATSHWLNAPSDKFEEFVVFFGAVMFPITVPFLCAVIIFSNFYDTAKGVGKSLKKRGKHVA